MGKRDLEILAAATIALQAFGAGLPVHVQMSAEEWERAEELMDLADEAFLRAELAQTEKSMAKAQRRGS